MSGPVTTTMSTKGQVILPKAIRENKRWGPGAKLIVEETRDGVILREAPLFRPTTMEDVFGSLKYDGPTPSIEDMDAGVLAEARRRWHAGD